MRQQLVVLFLAMSSWACATLPVTGERATGEPLKVVVNTETHSYIARDRVGQAEHRDSSGRVYATTDLYENRVANYQVTKWFTTQGGRKIDDQDFFRIAGDERTAAEIEDYRNTGVTMRKVGMGLSFGGGALAAFGYLLLPNILPRNPETGGSSAYLATYAVSLVGVAAIATGVYLWIFGNGRLNPDIHPVDDWRRAHEAGEHYNQNLPSAQPVRAARPASPDAPTLPQRPVRRSLVQST